MTTTTYMYAAGRIKALEPSLLSDQQLERLLTAKDTAETIAVARDTFAASLMSDAADGTAVVGALDRDVLSVKRLLVAIAPEPELLDFLWARYDFFNAAVIAKGMRAGFSEGWIVQECVDAGRWSASVLAARMMRGEADRLDFRFGDIAGAAERAVNVSDIDYAAERAYLSFIRDAAEKRNDPFFLRWVGMHIDAYALISRLRAYAMPARSPIDTFVSGGRFSREDISSEEATLGALSRLYRGKGMADAIEEYRRTRRTVNVERALDQAFAEYLRQEAYDACSPALLFWYAAARKTAIDVIRAVIIGRQSGVSERDIRRMLGRLYVHP